MNATPFDLSGRAALVTGCGSEAGIGFACARMIARLGARVAITSTTERIRERADELRAEEAEVSAHVADLTDREQAVELVQAAGPVDILVNSAGLAQSGVEMPFPPFRELAPETMRRQLDVTLMTAYHTTQAALPGMVSDGYGRIVTDETLTIPPYPSDTIPGRAASVVW